MTTPSIDSLSMMNPYMSYNDPYFWMAYNSGYNNNVTTPSFKGTSSTPSTTSATTTTTDDAAALAQLQTDDSASGKKKSRAGKILLGILVIGAAAFTCAACKKGNGATFLEKLKSGSKEIISGLKSKVTSSSAKLSITELEGGQKIVKIPDRVNIIRGNEAAKELAKIGEEGFTPEAYNNLLDASGKLKKGNQIARIKLDIGDGNFAIWSKGNEVSGNKFRIFDRAGKTPTNLTADYITNIKKAANDIVSGQGSIMDSRITELALNNTNAKTGLMSRIKYTRDASGVMKSDLVGALSDRFHLGHDAVQALQNNSPEIKKSIDAFIEGNTDKLNIIEAYVPNTSLGKFHLDGKGNILSITQNDGKVILAGTEKFDALRFSNAELFKTVSENKSLWKSKKYQL